MLALVKIPEHGDSVFATRSSKRTVRGHRNCVDVSSVAVVVCLQLELRKLPNLNEVVLEIESEGRGNKKCAGHDFVLPKTKKQIYCVLHTFTTLSQPADTITGLAMLGLKRTQDTLEIPCQRLISSRKVHCHTPFSVSIVLDIVFAFTQSVPEFDGPVTRTRDDLPVISAEADGKDIGGVADETASGGASVKVPEAESVVPGRRQSELAIRRDDNVRDEVVMSVEDALGVSVGVLVASQLPDDNGLVYQRDIRRNLGIDSAYSPREAVKIISGFSDDVAMAVTHPLCPSREPR